MSADQDGIGPALDAMLAIGLQDLDQLLPDEHVYDDDPAEPGDFGEAREQGADPGAGDSR